MSIHSKSQNNGLLVIESDNGFYASAFTENLSNRKKVILRVYKKGSDYQGDVRKALSLLESKMGATTENTYIDAE